jgi:hypothetical protein
MPPKYGNRNFPYTGVRQYSGVYQHTRASQNTRASQYPILQHPKKPLRFTRNRDENQNEVSTIKPNSNTRNWRCLYVETSGRSCNNITLNCIRYCSKHIHTCEFECTAKNPETEYLEIFSGTFKSFRGFVKGVFFMIPKNVNLFNILFNFKCNGILITYEEVTNLFISSSDSHSLKRYKAGFGRISFPNKLSDAEQKDIDLSDKDFESFSDVSTEELSTDTENPCQSLIDNTGSITSVSDIEEKVCSANSRYIDPFSNESSDSFRCLQGIETPWLIKQN